jgi:hypothetical protein
MHRTLPDFSFLKSRVFIILLQNFGTSMSTVFFFFFFPVDLFTIFFSDKLSSFRFLHPKYFVVTAFVNFDSCNALLEMQLSHIVTSISSFC